MALFVPVHRKTDKGRDLLSVCERYRHGDAIDNELYRVDPAQFDEIPGSPFVYDISDSIRSAFARLRSLSDRGITVAEGLNTTDNDRFLRLRWELRAAENEPQARWVPLAKGGEYSTFHSDLDLVINWDNSGSEIKTVSVERYGSESKRVYGQKMYFLPGITYSQRSQKGLSFRALPAQCIFNVKGPLVHFGDAECLPLLSLLNSSSFRALVELQTSFGSYNVGYLQRTPIPDLSKAEREILRKLARRGWSLKRSLDATDETSLAYLMPSVLRQRLGIFNPVEIEAELEKIQAEIDELAFKLYGFDQVDREIVRRVSAPVSVFGSEGANEDSSLISWCIGVAFGRLDWRFATGERQVPPEPEPFDPLPSMSPGMLPDGDEPFHQQPGILVDDPGDPHDLSRLVESVFERVDTQLSSDVRRWLQRDFFKEHLSQYSKNRRKAPIYWPLSTPSGNYTIWIYYPTLTSQTLYTAINDFLEPKLKVVADNAQALKSKSARSAEKEKEFAQLQALELELKELRETILVIAKDYVPNHDDGVQITAAPLWPLFQHKPWQKVLKDTWAKLEKGDYDWAHLAMNYWPDRVREKCKTDKSLAIAHDLEDLYSKRRELDVTLES